MNPKLENLQFLGVFGILQETLKLIYQRRKIFTQITLAFILPFCLFSFVPMLISLFFLPETKSSIAISPQIFNSLIFKVVYSILYIVFSLLSSTSVVYTVACIYTKRDVSFKHVISVVPKAWKRLLVTYLSVFIGLFAFSFVALLVMFGILVVAILINGSNGFSFDGYRLTIIFITVTIILVGTLYLSTIWQLSYVVSILEELCGFKAMAKSKALVEGKITMSIKLAVLLGLTFGVIQLVFYGLILQTPLAGKCILEIVLVLLFSFFFLVALVARTVLYFVCKSFHHEIVHELSLSDHLPSYLSADYYPLKVDDHAQIEKLQVV